MPRPAFTNPGDKISLRLDWNDFKVIIAHSNAWRTTLIFANTSNIHELSFHRLPNEDARRRRKNKIKVFYVLA